MSSIFQEIEETLNREIVINIFERLGITRYKETDNYVSFPTVCHNLNEDEASLKLVFYDNNKIFYCFTEDGYMSIFDFLKTYFLERGQELTWGEILDFLLEEKEFNFSKKEKEYWNPIRKKFIKEKKQIELTVYNEEILKIYRKYYPIEWLEDNISKQTMDKFNIYFNDIDNQIIIPHYNFKKELIGIRVRELSELREKKFGKYHPAFIQNRLYSHPLSLNLYGIENNFKNIEKTGYCFLFEGEKSVLQMDGYYENNCALAVCGSSLNLYQVKLLKQIPKLREIVICFDNEEKKGENYYFNKLQKIGDKYKHYFNFSFLYDFNDELEYKDSPSDRGKTIFENLLKNRIVIR